MSSYVRTTIKVVVLSKGDFEFDDLKDVSYAIAEGDCSGEYEVTDVEYLTAQQMREALISQGSDPDFLVEDEEV